jgi:NADPH:quinone reductase-like Zn-dependent oxidoreductase
LPEARFRGWFAGKCLRITAVKPRGCDLGKIGALVEAGRLVPVLDRVFPLNQIADAHRLSETGHARGKIVVKMV